MITDNKKWIKISKILFKHYKVKPDKLRFTTTDKDGDKFHNKAYYDLYDRTINLNMDVAENEKDLLTSILHEIHHMIDEKKLGFNTYDMMYQHEMGKGNYKNNKFEISAETFARQEINKWIHILNKF